MNTDYTQKIARLISTILVPPMFTLIVFTIFAFALENELIKRTATIIIALVFGFIAPIILFLILRKNGKLIDKDASVKEERTIPFIIAIIFYIVGLGLMIKFNLHIISIAFWFCYISNTIIVIFINHFWKISAHSMGAAGAFAALIVSFGIQPVGLFLLPVVFIVGWSRIKLQCHSFSQVAVGVLFAFLSTALQMYTISINFYYHNTMF